LHTHYLTPQQILVINKAEEYYLEALLSSASSISTLQVQELCPISPQRPQRLSARTLFAGFLLLLQLLPSFAAIKLDTSLTARVSLF